MHNTYEVAKDVPADFVDEVVIRLRKRGFKAHSESTECGKQFYVVSDASRAAVILQSGVGWFLR